MLTEWGERIVPESVWQEYPRPQMVRKGWTNLNGLWRYAITSVTNTISIPEAWEGTILVPFPIESSLSGVGRLLCADEFLWYARKIDGTHGPEERVLLHFGGVDFRTMVFVGHQEVTDVPHEGGHTPFTLDITEYLASGENELVICVWDPTEGFVNSRGKQSIKPEKCFYTRVSGIWQSVWMEKVPRDHIQWYGTKTDVDNGIVDLNVRTSGCGKDHVKVDVYDDKGSCVATGVGDASNRVSLRLPADYKLWSPERPNLYKIRMRFGEDEVWGYFGMRKFEKRKDAQGVWRFYLNNEPYFLIGILDQGWWPDGLLTPPSESALEFDIQTLKTCGFNAVRKHIKIEPLAYYAMCDRIGMLVVQDLPSGGDDWKDPMRPETTARYWLQRREQKEIMSLLQMEPSVIMWNPYNEGWSQPGAFLTHAMLDFVRRYDSTRLVNGPSGCWDWEGGNLLPEGWAWKKRIETRHRPETLCEAGDTVDMHVYRGPEMFAANNRRVSFLGEFGGLGHPVAGHMWRGASNEENGWGYGGVGDTRTKSGLENVYCGLMGKLEVLARKGLGGSVYTQSTDVESEVNGLMTYDRKVLKIDAGRMRDVHAEIFEQAKRSALGRQ